MKQLTSIKLNDHLALYSRPADSFSQFPLVTHLSLCNASFSRALHTNAAFENFGNLSTLPSTVSLTVNPYVNYLDALFRQEEVPPPFNIPSTILTKIKILRISNPGKLSSFSLSKTYLSSFTSLETLVLESFHPILDKFKIIDLPPSLSTLIIYCDSYNSVRSQLRNFIQWLVVSDTAKQIKLIQLLSIPALIQEANNALLNFEEFLKVRGCVLFFSERKRVVPLNNDDEGFTGRIIILVSSFRFTHVLFQIPSPY